MYSSRNLRVQKISTFQVFSSLSVCLCVSLFIVFVVQEVHDVNNPLHTSQDGRAVIRRRLVTGGVRELLETLLSVGGRDARRFLTQPRRGRLPVLL